MLLRRKNNCPYSATEAEIQQYALGHGSEFMAKTFKLGTSRFIAQSGSHWATYSRILAQGDWTRKGLWDLRELLPSGVNNSGQDRPMG